MFCRIPPDKLDFLPLFGFVILGDYGDFLHVRDRDGKEHMIDKTDPHILLEDISDALQLGASDIIQPP